MGGKGQPAETNFLERGQINGRHLVSKIWSGGSSSRDNDEKRRNDGWSWREKQIVDSAVGRSLKWTGRLWASRQRSCRASGQNWRQAKFDQRTGRLVLEYTRRARRRTWRRVEHHEQTGSTQRSWKGSALGYRGKGRFYLFGWIAQGEGEECGVRAQFLERPEIPIKGMQVRESQIEALKPASEYFGWGVVI